MSNGTTGTAASSLPAAGGTSSAGLADWAAPYITGYLGKAQALGDMPYQAYQGPLTAGPSQLQSQAFQGIGGLTVPNQGQYTAVGGSFTNMGAPQVPSAATVGSGGMGGMQQPMGGLGGFGQLDRAKSIPKPDFEIMQGQAIGAKPMYSYKDPATGEYRQSSEEEYGRLMGDYNRQVSEAGGPTIGSQFRPGLTSMPGGMQQPMGGAQAGMSTAQQYMNPYLQSVLDPQLAEMQRQSTINLQPQLAKLTAAGGYGGSREALLRGEAGRNLLTAQTGAIGKGYADAFDAARQQFNTEQQRKIQEAQFGAEFGLKGLAAQQGIYDQMAKLGGTQRDIEQQGIQADLEEFNRQREFPYKQIQFQRDMISGLPISSVTNTPAQLSGVAQLIGAVGGLDKLLTQTGQSSLGDLLSNLFGGNLGG